MSWRRVALAVGFAACITVVGFRVRFELGLPLLWPGQEAARLMKSASPSLAASWFGWWLSVWIQLFVWALLFEISRILWVRLRGWEAQRVARV